MHISIRCIGLLCCACLLTACSTFKGSETFRNRTYDYTEQADVNLPQLQTPSNLATPNFSPALTLPPGQNYFAPGNPPNMTPPGFNDQVPIPPPPPKAKSSNS